MMNSMNQKGISVVGSILMAGVVAAAAVGVSSLLLGRLKDEQQITARQTAEMIRRNVRGALAHDVGWRNSIHAAQNSAQFACLKSQGAVCSQASPTRFSLLMADNSPLIDHTNPAAGFDSMGNICSGFNAAQGNDKCPFRYELTWQCEGGTCEPTHTPALGNVPSKPRLRIVGRLLFSPEKNSSKSQLKDVKLREDGFGLSALRGEEERDLSVTCRSIGGYFDQGAKHCSVQSTNTGCDPVTQYFGGFAADGSPDCRSKLIINQYCPPGYAAAGLDEAGGIKCAKF